MQCILVLDILNGTVVHGLKGERSRYEPIDRSSQVVDSSKPLRIVDELEPKRIYVADLDRIMGRGDNLSLIREISTRAKTMADTGVSKAEDIDQLPKAVCPVLGTETASISLMDEVSRQRKVVASLDMSRRRVLSRDGSLAAKSPKDVLEDLNRLSLEAVIVLELDRVGTSEGLDGQFLEEAIGISSHPLILGGGVKDESDLLALEEMGFSGALVATAVHNGKVPLRWIQ